MEQVKQPILKVLAMLGVALLATALPDPAGAATQDQAEPAEQSASGGRAMAMQMEAEVVDVDLENRQVSLKGPAGDVVTVQAREDVVKLETVNVGDLLVVTYIAALEGELRAPTAEEQAEPWLVLEEGAKSSESEEPAVGAARLIRAVVTIEGMNRELGTVTVKDSRGKLHLIADVEPEKMAGVTLGQTAVLVFREALALSLERKQPAAE